MDNELIDAVREYAYQHYNKDGWDIVCETFDDEDIWNVIRGCRNASQSVRKMKKHIRVLHNHREEIAATAW